MVARRLKPAIICWGERRRSSRMAQTPKLKMP